VRKLDVAAESYPPGRIFLPLRAFEVGRKFAVSWDGKTCTATFTRVRDGTAARFTIEDRHGVLSNGTRIAMDVAPFVAPPGRTMLPFRGALEPFCMVEWYPYHQRAVATCDA
jgi:hypothetical protein